MSIFVNPLKISIAQQGNPNTISQIKKDHHCRYIFTTG